MKKKYILLTNLLFSSFVFSQVGINTNNPTTTLDVSVKKNGTVLDTNQTYGLQAPRLTRAELINISGTVLASSKYGADQKGALIYITDISGTDTGGSSAQRLKITAVGYYYFDGAIWQKVSSDTTTSTTKTEPWLVSGTTTEATSNTQNIYQTGNIGIRTTTPARSLHIAGTGGMDDDILIVSNSTTAPSAGGLEFERSKGTAAAPTAVTSGDALGTISFAGNDGTTNQQRARIDGVVNGTVASGNVPTDLTFSTGSTERAERMRINSAGNVGVGTSNPQNKLEITQGTGGKSGLRFTNLRNADILGTDENGDVLAMSLPAAPIEPWRVATTTNQASSNTENIYQMGNVGIGTTTPASKLDVLGKMNLDAANGSNTIKDVLKINIGRDGYGYGNRADNNGILFETKSSIEGGNVARMNFGDVNSSTAEGVRYLSFSVGKTLNEMLYITDKNSGAIGIGTTTPTHKLDVNGTTKTTNLTNGSATVSSGDFGLYNQENAYTRIVTNSTSNAALVVYNDGSAANNFSGSTAAMTVRNNKVGIGTASTSEPGNKLEITHGTTGNTGLRFTNLINAGYLSTNEFGDVVSKTLPTTVAAANEPWLVTGGTNQASSNTQDIYQTGNIGIRTITPLRALHITGTGATNDDILIVSNSTSGGSAGGLEFERTKGSATSAVASGDALGTISFAGNDGTTNQQRARIDGVVSGTVSANNVPTDLTFSTGSTARAERMRINSTGNVGIGVTNPGSKLDVAGTNDVSGVRLNGMKDAGLLGTDENGNIIRIVASTEIKNMSVTRTLNASATGDFTFSENFSSGLVTVRAANSCGRVMVSTFIYSGSSLAFLNGVARDKLAIPTIRQIPPMASGVEAQSAYDISFDGVISCATGGAGGDSTQFNFFITLGEDTNGRQKFTLKNNGNVVRTYQVSILKTSL